MEPSSSFAAQQVYAIQQHQLLAAAAAAAQQAAMLQGAYQTSSTSPTSNGSNQENNPTGKSPGVDEGETSTSDGTPNLNQILTIRLLMQGKEVGSIIGKRGDQIKLIREGSGAKINISDGSCPERIVTITGTSNTITKAMDMICTKFADDMKALPNSVPKPPITLRLIVPATQCGSIIGKGGSKIKEIRDATGASIQVASEMLPQSTERAVTLSGTAEAIVLCMGEVCTILIELARAQQAMALQAAGVHPSIAAALQQHQQQQQQVAALQYGGLMALDEKTALEMMQSQAIAYHQQQQAAAVAAAGNPYAAAHQAMMAYGGSPIIKTSGAGATSSGAGGPVPSSKAGSGSSSATTVGGAVRYAPY
ncbi:pes-4 [Pristionchus pacificus]|nr:pes-4 [Pristionchus pacificus]|eukprot:PDM67701.1 pes-4 [Pristionchus pacificus]